MSSNSRELSVKFSAEQARASDPLVKLGAMNPQASALDRENCMDRAQLERHLAERDGQAKKLAWLLETEHARVGELSRQVDALDRVRRKERAKLKREVNARQREIEMLLTSTSWRVAAPLRGISLSARWLLRNLRRGLTLVGWLATGQFNRAASAALPYYRRVVPATIRRQYPQWLRLAVHSGLRHRERRGAKLRSERQVANRPSTLQQAPPEPRATLGPAPRIVVYTCLFGNYESLKEPTIIDPRARYILFTDGQIPASSVWEIRKLPYELSSVRRTSRLPKILPHLFLPAHDVSVYLDSSLTLRAGDVRSMAEECLEGADMALYRHYQRNCVFDEISVCRELDIEDEHACRTYQKLYDQLGMPRNQALFENTLIVRKNNERNQAFNERWWKVYIGERDQLSIMAALHNFEIRLNPIKVGRQVRCNKYVTFTKHQRAPIERSDVRVFAFIAYAPNSYEKNLGRTYNEYMELLDDDDIAVFLDHDAMFCDEGWVDLIKKIFRNRRGEDLLLIGMANRIGKPYQRIGIFETDHSFASHAALTRAIRKYQRDRLHDVTSMTSSSGVVMALSKRTWRRSPFVDGFLKVDNEQHLSIRKIGGKILMPIGLYVYHFYRADGDLSHAQPLSN